jgi:predicted amidohydrolase
LFASFVEKAAAKGADIVCFPEGITLVATSKTYREVAESVPGPTTAFLGEYARRYSVYLVAGLLEKTPEAVYNTAVLIDRDGKLAGRYRKASLPREEIEGGITPGQEFPVFETDFGKIGMMICWDVQFVEPARRLAAKGAEIILLPIWGGSPELFPARTIENQVYLVTSSYDTRTGIWGPRGNVLAEAEQEGTIAVAKVDLAKRIQWEWLGNLRSRIAKEAPKTEEVP